MLTFRVMNEFPHDPTSYTQGLEFHDGFLIESTGRYGHSKLRVIQTETGKVEHEIMLSSNHFADGLARLGGQLIQLTCKERVAFVYDLTTLAVLDTLAFSEDGWGLCFDGTHLYMSNGQDTLFKRDPRSLEVMQRIPVILRGQPLYGLNELECVGDSIYSNVFMSDYIVQINKLTGITTGLLDASGLHPTTGRPQSREAVLNGIAHDPGTNTFFLTGKLWSSVFQVVFEKTHQR